jgi:nucleoside-diphosphate-sugar epimerase
MRYLVVGASGFVGCPLSRKLVERFGLANVQLIVPPVDRHAKEQLRRQALEDAGFDVVKYDILSRPPDILERVNPFDVLFHRATVAETERNSQELDQVNDVGTERLLQCLKPLLPGTRVVFTSSLAAVDRAFPDKPPRMRSTPARPALGTGGPSFAPSPSSNGMPKRLDSSGPSSASRPCSDRATGRGGCSTRLPRACAGGRWWPGWPGPDESVWST